MHIPDSYVHCREIPGAYPWLSWKHAHHITVPPVQQPRGNTTCAIHCSTWRAKHCCSHRMPCELEVVFLTSLTYDNRAHSCVWDQVWRPSPRSGLWVYHPLQGDCQLVYFSCGSWCSPEAHPTDRPRWKTRTSAWWASQALSRCVWCSLISYVVLDNDKKMRR